MKENTQLLIKAAQRGDVGEVQRLIPLSDPTRDDSYVLQVAALQGHVQCVELLIPVSDPKAVGSWALQVAAENGHTECVDLLFDVSDSDVALKQLKTEFPDDPIKWCYLQDKITAQKQRKVLTQETSQIHSASATHRKI